MGFLASPADWAAFGVLIALGVIGAGVSFFFGLGIGIFVSVIVAAMIGIVVVSSRKRHREIAQLTHYLEQVLYDSYTMEDFGNEEGELKVLRSEIYKMTVRLREQADALQKDKIYLADSIADISHQLRTPLTSMNLALSLLCREDCPPERRRALLRELTVLLNRMDSLISALLKISKIDAGTAEFQSEPVSVYRILEEAAELIAIPMELRGQTLQVYGDRGATFLGDAMWSVEALGNILKNCMEHMEENGTMTIHVTENVLFTEIVIQDDGKGIDPEDLPHIFERFYRGKNADSNSFGIGLALSRMIITQQNGTIKASNRFTGGTQFTIRFYKGAV